MERNESAVRGSHDGLLLQAVAVLQTRHDRYGVYDQLSSDETLALSKALAAVAAAEDDTDGVDREEAIALAHRLVDNDQPELSPMWPHFAG